MNKLRCRIAAVALLTAVPGSARGEAIPERWISEWGDGVCKLVRARGDPLAAYFMLEIVPGTQSLELWLVNPDVRLGSSRQVDDVSIRFEPAGTIVSDIVLRRYDYRGDRYYVAYGLSAESLDTLASATAIRLERSGEPILDIALPAVQRALPVLRQCMDDQLRLWGFDPETYNALQRTPRPIDSMAKWVSHADYPSAALRAGHTGRAVVRITVGVDGRARDCVTILSSGHRSLDARTCDISRRGRFEPALDAAGRQTEGLLVYSIRWMIG